MNKAILMAGLALAASGVSAQAQTADISPLRNAVVANYDRLYAIHSTMTNLNEVALGRLALTHSRNRDVRMIARMTMTEHAAAQRDLAAAARSQGYPIPRDPGPVNKAFAEKLSTMRGSAFDKMYMAAQTAGHEAAITLTQHELENGSNARIRAYAQNKLPGIIGHTSMIYVVAGKVNAPGSELRPTSIKRAAAVVARQKMRSMKRMGKM